jgi:hypothetical protein
MKKETQFFLFTDWSQTHANPAARGVEYWPPDRMNAPKPLRDAVEEFIEKILV